MKMATDKFAGNVHVRLRRGELTDPV